MGRSAVTTTTPGIVNSTTGNNAIPADTENNAADIPGGGGGQGNIRRGRRPRRRRTKRFLKCLNINARSLKYKMNYLEALVEEYKPHIISVTET